ncbi:MAG: DUF1810 domain-containing protein [Coriobacteriia bacterium]|nr:DUF1810 domain-containing protein [Coriobacteriia bacterium]
MQFDLDRFKKAQERDYATALAELRAGRKRTHWIWYVFPQIDGLGRSSTARYYAISGLDEAKAYLADPMLGSRLLECAQALLDLPTNDPRAVLGFPDDLKVCSSMTLFEIAGEDDARWKAFGRVLDKYYGGTRDQATRNLLEGSTPNHR